MLLQHNLANAVLYEYVHVLHISMVSVLSWTAETELLGEKFKNQTDEGINSHGNSLLNKLENKTFPYLKNYN